MFFDINLQTNIRNFSNYFTDNFNFNILTFKGKIYLYAHYIFIFFSSFIILFNNSIYQLIILLIIISLDAFSIVVLHECPLTALERKYLGISISDERNYILKNMKINYRCDHNYEKQIELLINVWLLNVFKILSIIFINTFNIQLKNNNSIYY